jgi:RNA polymerase sigma-70 factor (ECF subfamily)
MGGPQDRFETTDWTGIFRAQTQDEDRRRAAMEAVCRRYWKPVYCYLRRKGCGNEEAKDLTQGFFAEVVLGRELIQKADAAKGRFRNFLLASLERYVANVHRAAGAQKRRPSVPVLAIEDLEAFDVPDDAADATPEGAFHRQWAAALLEQVLDDVEHQCRSRGEEAYWLAFRDRVVSPILEDSLALPLADICDRYGIASPSKASNMIVTVKRRFRATLAQHVRWIVASEAEVDAEIDDLLTILSAPRAGF